MAETNETDKNERTAFDNNETADNSDRSFQNCNICIRLAKPFNNDFIQKRMNNNNWRLCKKFPGLKELPGPNNKLEAIIKGVFPTGFPKEIFVRNYFHNDRRGKLISQIGIRPKRTPGDFLEQYLPEDASLEFKGRIYGKEFSVDSIIDIADSERLDYEAAATVIPCVSAADIRNNFLNDLAHSAGSLPRYTQENLNEWKEYLRWKNELINRQIKGCKYYKVRFDENRRCLVFWLVFNNKEAYQRFAPNLRKSDIAVYSNNFSKTPWHFEYAGDTDRSQRPEVVRIGEFINIVKEYRLKDNIDASNNRYILTEEERLDWEDGKYDADEEDEEILEASMESYMCECYDDPYIVQAAYELSGNTVAAINRERLDQRAVNKYIHDNVLDKYFPNGFLASSATGEKMLMGRFQRAINQIEHNEQYSPNLAMWLFDIKNARLFRGKNEVVIDKWLNPQIEKNSNQREAVQKMLAAPDVCLIQGPPGTGKTTVIAEAIYQFASRGNRVLVSSQSNDAVDNALERLAASSEIRAIRLEQKRKPVKNINDGSKPKFDEDNLLKYYYHALSQNLSAIWLDRWNALEKESRQYDIDRRDAIMFNEDIKRSRDKLSELNACLGREQELIQKNTRELENAKKINQQRADEEKTYRLARDCFAGNIDTIFFLPEELLLLFADGLNTLIDEALQTGVIVIPERIDLNRSISGQQSNVYLAARKLRLLEGISSLLEQAKSSQAGQKDGRLKILEDELQETKQKMMECVEAGDDDGVTGFGRRIREINQKIKELEGPVSIVRLSDRQRNILSAEAAAAIENSDEAGITAWRKKLDGIIERWKVAIKEIFVNIEQYLSKKTDIDTKMLTQNIESGRSAVAGINYKIKEEAGRLASKEQQLNSLYKKYETASEADTLISTIEQQKKNAANQLEQQKSFRQDWEETLVAFKKRLEDNESFKYDQHYYLPIYKKSCNVIGISCTANERLLEENGYSDFDVAIIDEVSKATPPELLIPLMKARKAILVGDHRQLPPMFKEHEASYKEMIEKTEEIPEEIQDLLTEENFGKFQKMVTSSLFKDYFEKADESIKHSLLVQYRMHSDIMNIINRFYENRLQCGSKETEEKDKNHALTIAGADGSTFIVPEKHAYWIDSSCMPGGKPVYDIQAGTSYCNIFEQWIVIELLKRIAAAYKKQGVTKERPKTVGVISFYQRQINMLRKRLIEASKKYDFSSIDVAINTVDRFQGQEKNIIITSLVRNNRGHKASRHVVAFERMNVAFSRAQELLFIVGSKAMYEGQEIKIPNMDNDGCKTIPAYKNIIGELMRKGCFVTSNKLIAPEMEEKIVKDISRTVNGGKLWRFRK